MTGLPRGTSIYASGSICGAVYFAEKEKQENGQWFALCAVFCKLNQSLLALSSKGFWKPFQYSNYRDGSCNSEPSLPAINW
jgi:hypothetical protein